MVHAETRKRGLVDKLYDLGLSISYNRVLEISTAMGNRVCAQFEEENAVCPINLRTGLFTTSALDNIDHNPSSTTATGSLHGTGISLFQHPTPDNPGQEREFTPTIAFESTKSITPLPQDYSSVPPVDPWAKEPSFPETSVSLDQFKEQTVDITAQYEWLNHVKDELDGNESNDEIQIMSLSWAAFYASRIPQNTIRLTDINSLLPLFQEEAHSVAMILHAMNIVNKSVQVLNPGQIPVIACDQPLYAIAKRIQWHWPETHGESKFIIMLGGLHVEAATLRALGDWLGGSGWTSAIVQANIASPGTAESFLKASHISRTRHAHEVTASSLYVLMYRAYLEFSQALTEEDQQLDFWQWHHLKSSESPEFLYWALTLKFELLVLMFVQSLREGNFNLYQESLKQLVPLHFALDHFHYARWLPIHIHDMVKLSESHPNVEGKFQQGHFVVNKTQRVFSGISLDQAHEQNNKLVKGDGGAVGLTENSSQLLRWMVSGPEVARAAATFEAQLDVIKSNQSKGPDMRHHDQVSSVQTNFKRQVQALIEVIEGMGNPFKEESNDLLVLDTKEIASEKVITTVKEIEKVGLQQFHSFVEERLIKKEKGVMDVIKRNKLALFSNPQKPPSKEKQGVVSLKQNCSLFSQLYVSCQVRQGNLDEFFTHENQAYPPSISQFGDLKLGVKSDLMKCLEKLSPGCQRHPTVDATLIDGAALVNMLKPSKESRTFTDYVNVTYLPYIEAQLLSVQRVDIIWDIYVDNSLKASTRSKRGTGIRQRVEPGVKLPKNWPQFLKVDSNKVELFHYLAEQTGLVQYEWKCVLVTKDSLVLSSSAQITDNISPCTHEEADTRLLLHAADCARQGLKKVLIRTVDTDVVVIAVSVFSRLNLDELWIAFGVGKYFKYIAVHSIVRALGPQKSSTLHVFHAFTGCDQTSAFLGRGKTTAWETWMAYEEVTMAFLSLSQSPTEQDIVSAMPRLERFVVLMYDRTSTCENVNKARKVLFTQKGRSIENIPPTSDALQLHTKRVAYQAGHCWGQCDIPCPVIPSPSEWGWTMSEEQLWKPLWMTLPEASKACRELLRCGCRMEKGCKGHCKCRKAEMQCTALCKCGGDCQRD